MTKNDDFHQTPKKSHFRPPPVFSTPSYFFNSTLNFMINIELRHTIDHQTSIEPNFSYTPHPPQKGSKRPHIAPENTCFGGGGTPPKPHLNKQTIRDGFLGVILGPPNLGRLHIPPFWTPKSITYPFSPYICIPTTLNRS